MFHQVCLKHSISRQLMDLQTYRAALVAARAKKRPLNAAEQRTLAVTPDQSGWLGVMRAVRAPSRQCVPFAQITWRHVQASVHACH